MTSALLVPLMLQAIETFGFATSSTFRSAITDLLGLVDETLVRALVFAPAIAFVLVRERWARPFRSWRILALATIVALPCLALALDLIASQLGAYPFQNGLLLEYLKQASGWISSSFDSNTLLGAFFSLLIISFLFSGFAILPYIFIYAAWRKRIGPISKYGSSLEIFSLPLLARILRRAVFSPQFRAGLSWVAILLVITSAPLAATQLPLPQWGGVLLANWISKLTIVSMETRHFVIGIAGVGFWSITLIVLSTTAYLIAVKPNPRITAYMVLIAPTLVLSYVWASDGWDTDTGKLVLAIGAIISVWIVPVFGIALKAYQSFRYAFGLARNAIIKDKLRDENRILLLRSFALDEMTLRRSPTLFGNFDVFGFLRIRLEEVLVRECFLVAPVIAVANPSETQDRLGALREYLSDDRWQPFVSDQIAASRRIIFILGKGNFTGWETDKILEANAVDKVVFVVPPDPESALRYLEQNPEVCSLAGGEEAIKLVRSGRVRCFVIRGNEAVFVVNKRKEELAYILAMRRAITLN